MTDLTSLNAIEQTRNQILNELVQATKGGVVVNPAPTSYAVAGLPTTGVAAGQFAWAANGRKPGEGAGVGSGVPVFFNPATGTWYSYLSAAQVTV